MLSACKYFVDENARGRWLQLRHEPNEQPSAQHPYRLDFW
jgi:hypothetical protein